LKTGIALNDEFCLKQLEDGLNKKDSDKIDIFMSVGFLLGFSYKYVPILCKLLLFPYHHSHEDIARVLQEIADISTVEYLYEATELKLDYLNYDDTYQFARKCIKALSAINNSNATNKLILISNNNVKTIAEYAKKELYYKGIL
jgi:hypothetical protein